MSTAPAVPALPDLLADIATLLADPAHWTQGAFARKANGQGCDPRDPEAAAWCMLGALHKVTHPTNVIMAMQWLHATITTAPNPIWFNDNRSHADVLAALAHAREVALADAQELTDEPTDTELPND